MMEFQGSRWESQFVTTNKRPNGPRMSSERIDLTQYEMIRGPWEPCPWEKDEVIDKSPNGRDGTIALVVPWGKNREVSEVHKKAIANLPNIITELKKHYELLDEIVRIWFCSPHLSEEHHADITKILAEYEGISHLL